MFSKDEGALSLGFCLDCVKHEALKNLIEKYGKSLPLCPLCGAEDKPALPYTDMNLKKLFRALIRYHYMEEEHNSGSTSHIMDLFDQSNEILKLEESDLEYWDLLEVVVQNLVEVVDDAGNLCEEIPLSSEDENGVSKYSLVAMKIGEPEILTEMAKRLQATNYFLIENEALDLFREHATTISYKVEVLSRFYRARIGYEKCGLTSDCTENGRIEKHYLPFSGPAIGSPPPFAANAGRLNRPGVTFLYLASDRDTAIAEVRPHPGHVVTIAAFANAQPLNVARVVNLNIYDFYHSSSLLDYFWLMTNIDGLLSMPVVPELRNFRYRLTQFLADIFRRVGFHGVVYRSSITSGENLVIFDPSILEQIPDSLECVEVTQVIHCHTAVTTMCPEYDYSNIEAWNSI